jgi:hypothetical protein
MGQYELQSVGPLRGLNENEDPHSKNPADLLTATNVASYGRMLGTRPGFQRPTASEDYETAIAQGNPVQGMYEWRSDLDANRKLLVVAEHTAFVATTTSGVFYEDDARFAAGATISGAGTGAINTWTMTEHRDIIYAAGGDASTPATPDSFWYLDPSNAANAPTAIVLPVSAGNPAAPQYVLSWRNYVFCNGLRNGTVADNNPTATRYHTLGTDPKTAANWLVGNTIGFDAYGDNFTTGLATYRDNKGDFLLVLGNKKLQSVVLNAPVDFQITDAIANGCLGQRAYVSLGLDSGEAIYMSYKGFHSLRQSQTHGARAGTFLSWKIRPTFASLNRSRMKYSVGAYDHVNGWVIFAVATGSDTANDTLLVLDVKDQDTLTAEEARWYVWKLSGGIRVVDMKYIRDSNDDWKLALGTTLGDVLYLDTTVFNDVSVDGSTTSAYAATARTADNDYGSTLDTKGLGDIMVTLQPGGAYTPTFRAYFDYGSRKTGDRSLDMSIMAGATFGSGVFGTSVFATETSTRDEKVYGTGSGRTIGFEITHSASDEPWRVSKIDHQVMIQGESTGDST